jgi:4-hydroxybenzoate polyprenyltransferase
MFVAFCATASGIYLGNDLMDLAADRRHPRKRLRPFARGALPLQQGVAFAALLVCLGAIAGWLAGTPPIILIYAALSMTYSLHLKQQPLADVFTLAALYTIRLVGGGEASGHALSLWLLAFSTFLFLSLALMKRVQELLALRVSRIARRGYMAGDEAILQMFGCASAFAASVVLALFVQSETAMRQYRSPALLWAIVPVVLFWQCRLWLSTARGYMRDDPILYAARDWVSWLVAGLSAVLLVAAQSITLTGL